MRVWARFLCGGRPRGDEERLYLSNLQRAPKACLNTLPCEGLLKTQDIHQSSRLFVPGPIGIGEIFKDG